MLLSLCFTTSSTVGPENKFMNVVIGIKLLSVPDYFASCLFFFCLLLVSSFVIITDIIQLTLKLLHLCAYHFHHLYCASFLWILLYFMSCFLFLYHLHSLFCGISINSFEVVYPATAMTCFPIHQSLSQMVYHSLHLHHYVFRFLWGIWLPFYILIWFCFAFILPIKCKIL